MLTPTEPKYLKILSTKSVKKCTEYRLQYPSSAFKRGACVGVDTEVYFPAGDSFTKDDIKLLSKICDGCSVKNVCLEWALASERSGYWGGTTPQQRVAIRRRIKWTLPTIFNFTPKERYGS
jgi:hypothetical protein